MTFSYTLSYTKKINEDDNVILVCGKFSNPIGGDVGGNITPTPLRKVYFAKAEYTGAAAVSGDPVFNNTFSKEGTDSPLALVTTDSANGIWWAIGTR